MHTDKKDLFSFVSVVGFKKTYFLLFATLAIARAVPVNNPQTCIQTDQSSKDLISEMLLLLKNLSTDVTNSISKIVSSLKIIVEEN